MKSDKLVIGIVGEKGSGKETFGSLMVELRKDLKIERVRFADILGETLDLWGIARNRSNLQQLAIVMNHTYGDGTLTEALRLRVAALKADVVLIDGIRWESDLVLLRKFPKNFLVYITAPLKVRFARTRARKEKLGEAHTSFAQFKREETVKTELFITKIGAEAEYKIVNGATLANFKQRVRAIARDL